MAATHTNRRGGGLMFPVEVVWAIIVVGIMGYLGWDFYRDV